MMSIQRDAYLVHSLTLTLTHPTTHTPTPTHTNTRIPGYQEDRKDERREYLGERERDVSEYTLEIAFTSREYIIADAVGTSADPWFGSWSMGSNCRRSALFFAVLLASFSNTTAEIGKCAELSDTITFSKRIIFLGLLPCPQNNLHICNWPMSKKEQAGKDRQASR